LTYLYTLCHHRKLIRKNRVRKGEKNRRRFQSIRMKITLKAGVDNRGNIEVRRDVGRKSVGNNLAVLCP